MNKEQIQEAINLIENASLTPLEVSIKLGVKKSRVLFHYKRYRASKGKCKKCEMLLASKFHQQFPCEQDFMVF